jgi:nucleoside-diphosphate-sugar epimerase
MSILEFAQIIKNITDNQAEITYLPNDRSERDPQRRKPDITRAREILGWSPKVDLIQGLQQTIPYFKSRLGLA